MELAPGAVLTKYDGLLMDLDGVVYLSGDAVPYSVESVSRAEALGRAVVYVTNNASRPPSEIAAQIESYGLACSPEQVVTSAQVAAEWLAGWMAEKSPSSRRVLAVGGAGLHEALRSRGFTVSGTFDGSDQVVVQGFGPDVSWRDLAQASYALMAGCTWLATNLDVTVPTSEGVALGNGALVAALTAATGRVPDVTTGKPEATPFRSAAARAALARPLVVGDRLDTDIAGAVASGTDSLLVLTGVSTVDDLVEAPPAFRPTFVDTDLRGLFATATPLTPRGRVVLRGWTCDQETRGGQTAITLDGHGDWIDGVRAVAMTAWWAQDAGGSVTYGAALEHARTIGSSRADP